MNELWVGLLSGTSMDAASAALINLEKKPKIIKKINNPWPISLKKEFQNFQKKNPTPFQKDISLEKKMGNHFAKTALKIMKGKKIKGIGFHGQTAAHKPKLGWTLQVGDPQLISNITGLTVWSDFRSNDIKMGGEGAPLASIIDEHQWTKGNVLRVNLGGIMNATYISEKEMISSDISVCNYLLDSICKKENMNFDNHGKLTFRGIVEKRNLKIFRNSFHAKKPPKSTHVSEWENELKRTLSEVGKMKIENQLSSAANGIVLELKKWIKKNCKKKPSVAYFSGGGIFNKGLMELFQLELGKDTKVEIDPLEDSREAYLFAFLAKMASENVKINQPQLTGAKEKCMLGKEWNPQY